MLFPLDRKSWTLTSEQCWCFSTSTFAGGNFWPSSYLHGGVFITPLFLSIRLLIAWYGDINILFFCPSQYQANSFEEAINIVNRNKYFLKFSSLVVYITILFLILLKKYYMWFVCDLYFWNRYGNGASIFTTSGVAARKFQTEIEAGQVRVTSSIIVLELHTGWFTTVGNYLSTLWTTFSDILFTTFVSLYMMERFRTLHDLIKLLSCIGFLNYSFAAASVLSGIHNSQPFLFWLRLASMFLSQFLCRSSHLLALRHLLQAISISMVKYLPSICNYIFFSFTVVVTCI